MSSQPIVPPARPVFAGSMIHFQVPRMSAQVMADPSDHFMPGLRVQVTSIPEPTILTPPLSTVGTFEARFGVYLRSGVTLIRLSYKEPETSMSVSAWAKYGLTVSGNCHSARTSLPVVTVAASAL